MTSRSTATDPSQSWRIVDPVSCLRALETGEVYPLPPPAMGDAILGAAAGCAIELRDPTRRVSRRHARLVWSGALWSISDLDSKNGTWIDGARRAAGELIAGVEVCVGGLTLLAESPRLLALRALVARLVGWSAPRARVDTALRALRDAALRRAVLVLCGEGDVVGLAARLHRETLGDRPFVVADGGSARALAERARDGTLCIDLDRPPRALAALIADGRERGAAARLVVCAPTAARAAAIAAAGSPTVTLVVPPLSTRLHDLPRLIAEYADDAARELGRPSPGLTAHDWERLSTLSFSGHADLEDTLLRLVAIRAFGVSAAGARLGVSHAAMSRWAKRRRLSSSPM